MHFTDVHLSRTAAVKFSIVKILLRYPFSLPELLCMRIIADCWPYQNVQLTDLARPFLDKSQD